MTAPDTAAVRAWARDQGIAVAERGRLPAEVRAAYLAANPASKTAARKATAKTGPAKRPTAADAKRPARTGKAAADAKAVADPEATTPERPAPARSLPSVDARLAVLEAQVGELTARLAKLEQPAAAGAKPSRFRRRSS